jgi:hypothetical protein
MTRIVTAVALALLILAGTSSAGAADQATELGANWYCLMKFKMAGLSPNNNDPAFLNCIRQRSGQVERESDSQAARQRAILQQRQNQLRRQYGASGETCATQIAQCRSCPNGRATNTGGACFFDNLEECRRAVKRTCVR